MKCTSPLNLKALWSYSTYKPLLKMTARWVNLKWSLKKMRVKINLLLKNKTHLTKVLLNKSGWIKMGRAISKFSTYSLLQSTLESAKETRNLRRGSKLSLNEQSPALKWASLTKTSSYLVSISSSSSSKSQGKAQNFNKTNNKSLMKFKKGFRCKRQWRARPRKL